MELISPLFETGISRTDVLLVSVFIERGSYSVLQRTDKEVISFIHTASGRVEGGKWNIGYLDFRNVEVELVAFIFG